MITSVAVALTPLSHYCFLPELSAIKTDSRLKAVSRIVIHVRGLEAFGRWHSDGWPRGIHLLDRDPEGSVCFNLRCSGRVSIALRDLHCCSTVAVLRASRL